MRRTKLMVCAAAVCAATAAGCLNPYTTRLPTLALPPPAVERRSEERFDPFANQSLGPETETRPRDFSRSRTPVRQIQEGRLLPGVPSSAAQPGFSDGAYRDQGDVVR